jgi:hypothetical protein
MADRKSVVGRPPNVDGDPAVVQKASGAGATSPANGGGGHEAGHVTGTREAPTRCKAFYGPPAVRVTSKYP